LLDAPRPQRQPQFQDRRDHKDRPGNKVTPANQEIAAAMDIRAMKASLEIKAARDEPAIRAAKVGMAEKAVTRHAQQENIATQTPRLAKRAASETNNLTGKFGLWIRARLQAHNNPPPLP